MLAGAGEETVGVPPPLFAWQPPSVAELQRLLPDFELLELIGRGGMGAVYRARQPSLDRLVAIKLLPAETAEMAAGFAERFKNEARLLARMNHPGIVHVYDFGTLVDGSCYIVMEYVDGSDVARMVAASGKLPPEHAASITADVCAALHYAHEAGIVHRDIKPGNILITRQGQVKVADFGLAKQHDTSQLPMTQTGITLGTPEFLAPESLLTGMVVDHRADLYAVGVMLYNMLTGQIPRGVFKPASKAVASAPAFDDIIHKAMQADPEQRYQTAHALKTDVQRAIQAKPKLKAKPWHWAVLSAVVVGLAPVTTMFYSQHHSVAPPASTPIHEPAAATHTGGIVVEDPTGNALSITNSVQNFGPGWDTPSGVLDVKAIASGHSAYSLALKNDGTVVAWGLRATTENSPPSGLSGVVTIGLGSFAYHALAARADGRVVAWGANNQGQCNVPAGLTDVIAVSGGRTHSVALKKDGTVVAWGGGSSGLAKVHDGLSDVIAIGAGSLFSVALKKDGSVVTRGFNTGIENVPESARSGVIAISAAPEHVLALKKDGSVIAWGSNEKGQTTVPNAARSGIVAIAAGTFHSLALKSDGRVIVWGNSGPPPTDFRARAISAGGYYSLAIVQRTKPVRFDSQPAGASRAKTFTIKNLGAGPLTTDKPSLYGTDVEEFALDTSGYSSSIAANGKCTLTVTFNPTTAGTKSAFLRIPSNDSDTPYYDIPLTGTSTMAIAATTSTLTSSSVGLSDVQSIAAGDDHSLALRKDGTVVAWGANNKGQCSVPVGLSGVVAIGSGCFADHSLAVRKDGSVVAWGANEYGECDVPTGLTGVVAVCAGKQHSLALKADGTVVAWGSDRHGQCSVPSQVSHITAIAAGALLSVALRKDGLALAWGANASGKSKVPAQFSGVTAIATGGLLSLALRKDGSVVPWTPTGASPVEVPQSVSSGVASLSAGDEHVLALTHDGSVIAWGLNSCGQTNVPAAASSGVIAIAAGSKHSLALRSDGRVIAWGRNDTGQATPPANAPASSTGAATTADATSDSIDMSDEAINAMFLQLQRDNPGLPRLMATNEGRVMSRVERKPDELVLGLGNLPELKNISALKDSAFTHLAFRNSLVTDFRVLRTMKQLRSLVLDLPEGTNCEQFRGLHLQEITAGRLANLEPFAGPQLSIIQATSPVKDLAFLSQCLNLKALSIWESSVEDLSPLRELPLEHLTLPNANVQSLEPLRGKPITSIDIRGCPVSDLSPLLDNPKLKELQCDQGTFNADSLKAHLGK